jgi:hypothetical protein
LLEVWLDLVLSEYFAGALTAKHVHTTVFGYLLPLDVDTFNACHGEEEILDQEGLLDVDWERAKVLRSVILASTAGLWILKEVLILLSNVVVIQMGSFKEPIGQMWNRCLHNIEHSCLRDL